MSHAWRQACAARDKLLHLGDGLNKTPWSESPPSARRLLSSAVAVMLLFFGLGIVAGMLDPFGLSRATNQHSSSVAARVLAPYYGRAESTAQDRIAVVLITDDTLQERETSWPPRYSYHEEVLRRILRQGPRAVYYDIYVDAARDFDESLGEARDSFRAELEAARTQEHTPVPVFFGVPRPGVPLAFGVSHQAHPLLAAWHGAGPDYPLVIPAMQAGIGNEGRVSHSMEAAYPSVALALYRTVCQGTQRGCAQDAATLRATDKQQLAVRWGSTPPRHASSPDCSTVSRGPLLSSLQLAWSSLASGLRPNLPDSQRVRCPYTVTVLEHELDDERIAALLHDRVVLVGTQIQAMEDLTQSPVHGALPGVYLHAMALDNLMTWGDQHPYRSASLGLVFALVVGAVVSVAAAWIFGYLAGAWRGIALVALGMAATFFAVLVPWALFRQPAPDWLGGVALFSLIIFGLGGYQSRHAPPVESAGPTTRTRMERLSR